MVEPLLWQQIVSYGAVGGTKAPDLMTFPPDGFRPFEQRVRIGHGEARWNYAWQETLTWGIQRRSGMNVDIVESPGHIAEGTYNPVSFDTAGTPIPSRLLNAGPLSTGPVSTGSVNTGPVGSDPRNNEAVYDASGRAFIAPGDTAVLSISAGPFQVSAPCRVIYVIDEPKRKGFAYGTLPGHPQSGEEVFVVSKTDDGSVWLSIRAFSRPSTAKWRALTPFLRLAQRLLTRRYFRALSGSLG